MFISSHPLDLSLDLTDLNEYELAVIATFVYYCKLGAGISPYRDAVYSLMSKIEAIKGEDYFQHASQLVQINADVMDANGSLIDSYSIDNIEFDIR